MRVAARAVNSRRLLKIGLCCVLAGHPAASEATAFEAVWVGVPAGCDIDATIVPPDVTTPTFFGPYLGLTSLVPYVWDRSCAALQEAYAAAAGRTHAELDPFRVMHSGNFSFTLADNAWFVSVFSAYSMTRLDDSITVTGGTGQGLLRLRLSYTATASSSSAREPVTTLFVYVVGQASPFAQLRSPGTLDVDIPFTFDTPVFVKVEIATDLGFPELVFQRGGSANGRFTATATVLSAAALTLEGQPVPGARVLSSTSAPYPEPPPCPGKEASFAASQQKRPAAELFVEPSPGEAESAENGSGSAERGVLRARFARLSQAAIATGELTLNLFPGLALRAVLDRAEPQPGGLFWTGHLDGKPFSQVTLRMAHGRLTGKVSWDKAAFSVRHVSGGLHRIEEIDLDAIARVDSPPAPPPPAKDTGLQTLVPPSDDGSTVDLLVVYTPAAWAGAGGTAAIDDLIALGVGETNQAYANSEVIQRLRLVHTAEVSYAQSDDLKTDLSRLTEPSDGFMDEVHALRDLYGADLVQLVVDSQAAAKTCGLGWVMPGNDPGFGVNAFSVVERTCLLMPIYTVAHELGHNMGLNHARSDEDEPGAGSYPYAYGYKHPGGLFHDLMAYPCPGGCPAIPHYSNPDVTWCGEPTGILHTAIDAADNARALNNTRLTVANWRVSRGEPPAAATAISPSETITTRTPDYEWTAVPTATDYFLWVSDETGQSVLQSWYSGTEVCSGNRCSVRPAAALVNGLHQWRVLARNPFGNGPWSSALAFTVSIRTLSFRDGFESGDLRAWSLWR